MVDAAPISLFTGADVPFFCAVSFSKNFGLYGERTGVLHAVLDSAQVPLIPNQTTSDH